jgi:hypothetical protein
MKKSISLLAFAVILSACGTKQNTTTSAEKSNTVANPKKYAESITASDLKTALYVYASDEFEGRNTGEEGERKAHEFLKEHYMKYGVSAAKKDGDYLQAVAIEKRDLPKASIKIGNKAFEFITNFVSLMNNDTEEVNTKEVVYVGYGIEDEKYSSYNAIDVKDKVILVKAGEPKNEDGTFVISGTTKPSKWTPMQTQFESKLELAKAKGAKAVLFYLPDAYSMIAPNFSKASGRMSVKGNSDKLFFLLVDKTVATTLVNDIDTNTETTTITTDFNLNYEKVAKSIEAHNVAAFIKGSEKPNEIIAISAHLDHIGIENGEIFNGADDDGSGTVAVLEIAEAFAKAKKDGHGPKRSILFLNVTGEEKGLLGSQYYTDVDPIFPLENTIADLNIDMIGRTDPKREKKNRNYVYLIGSDKLSTELHNISEAVNTKYMNIDLDYTFNDKNDPNRFYYRSDHYNFAKKNIPVIFYFNGTHDDYHQASDTVDKIQYDLLENRTRLVFYTAWELANREQRIVLDKSGDE